MSIKNIVNILSFAGALSCSTVLLAPLTSCARTSSIQEIKPQQEKQDIKRENLIRSMALIDQTVTSYFHPETFEMSRFYNPFTKVKSAEKASVWMYSAGIEAINAVLSGLVSAKENGDADLYETNFRKYEALLVKMYAGADYYLGTFELTSFTQTKEWSVYAVDRVKEKGKANVTGILNVYDDQMWLVRELLDSYKITGNQAYLDKAEYLTSYVLDGWDVTIDENGKENGGIPWGPGYTTKHACSNSPLISSLVWLHTIYKGKDDQIEHRFIDTQDRETRRTEQQRKETYYLDYAKSIYDWQKEKLLNTAGVYADMMGGCDPNCTIVYEEIDGKKYRANTKLTQPVGEAFTYNSGTMLSGAVDLFNATKEANYLKDAETLGAKSFEHFASLGKEVPQFYSFGTNGFKNWFNGILMRGYRDLASVNTDSGKYLSAFQDNLDHGYERFNHEGFLPTNLLKGWTEEKRGNGVEGMFMFTFAAQYAVLAEHYYTL